MSSKSSAESYMQDTSRDEELARLLQEQLDLEHIHVSFTPCHYTFLSLNHAFVKMLILIAISCFLGRPRIFQWWCREFRCWTFKDEHIQLQWSWRNGWREKIFSRAGAWQGKRPRARARAWQGKILVQSQHCSWVYFMLSVHHDQLVVAVTASQICSSHFPLLDYLTCAS
jgi:hypothetical protein